MSHLPRSGASALLASISAILFTSFLAGCSGGTDPAPSAGGAPGVPESEAAVVRERVAAMWIEGRLGDAREELARLVDTDRPATEDLMDAGRIEYALAKGPDDFARARAYFEDVLEREPERPGPYFLLGQLAQGDADFEGAKAHLERALELAPDDYPTRLALANVLNELGDEKAAEAHYRALLDVGLDAAGSWHVSTTWRLGQLLAWRGDEEGERLMTQRQQYEKDGVKAPTSTQMLRGSYGEIDWSPPRGIDEPAAPSALQLLAAPEPLPAELGGAAGIAARTLRENWERVEAEGSRIPESTSIGAPDVVAWGPAGLVLVAGAGSSAERITSRPVEHVAAFDVDNDGDLDFLATSGAAVVLVFTEPDGWREQELAALPSAPRDVLAVDYDHEGDLDLLFVGDFGARLWRNDGYAAPFLKTGDEAPEDEAEEDEDEATPAEEPVFTDVTASAGFPSEGRFDWCVAEDFDTDQDVDFLLGGPDGARLCDSLRGGAFEVRTDGLPAGAMLEPIVADLGGDAWPDLWVPAGDGTARLFTRRPSGRFEETGSGAGPATADYRNPRGIDLDLDGHLDAVWDTPNGPRARLALRLDDTPVFDMGPRGASVSASDDFDGDGAIDLVVSSAAGAALHRGATTGSALRLALHAPERDNRRGRGAIVELRAGDVYRRLWWDGEPTTIGLGGARAVDVLRVTWPRGVEQHDLDVAAGARWCMERVQRIEGSCPFLYTWNGETYEFVTDVLGITPLGLPMAPGMMVPPDHDEYVLVRGEQMVPREEDGRAFYDLQLTEELREVTYLDRVRLDVVDHPEDTEVFPNERFSFPPFPEAHTHVVRDPLVPERAGDSAGRDWTEAVAAIDGDYAIPFDPYRGLYTGLAAPHFLELAFDAERVEGAELLRLICTGWFLWSDASINMLAARTPGVDFVPPILSVPDPTTESGWRDTGPPVGFPAGKRKTMVLDVTGLLNRDDPRIRISGTLCIYWDAIRLATGGDGALRVTSLEPTSANLWQRGFSRSFKPIAGHMLEWFDWDELDEPRWDQHPGAYTRLGETVSLLGAIDDRFAILGAGDALRVQFDAAGLPPLPEGWRRDFLLFLDGWAKDRDPNTLAALYVEPLPFHGMSGYPYGEGESFPNGEVHRAWRREWNTRPATTWIEPLAPGREALRRRP